LGVLTQHAGSRQPNAWFTSSLFCWFRRWWGQR